jgi:hypothetical protein
MIMNWIRFALAMILCVLFVACQRFEPMEQREGLDNDSHSYSYVGYPHSRMITAAKSIKGVKSAEVKYNGEQIIMTVYVDKRIPKQRFPELEKQIRRVVADSAPINPFRLDLKYESEKKPSHL